MGPHSIASQACLQSSDGPEGFTFSSLTLYAPVSADDRFPSLHAGAAPGVAKKIKATSGAPLTQLCAYDGRVAALCITNSFPDKLCAAFCILRARIHGGS
jgi:hypothetical protein